MSPETFLRRFWARVDKSGGPDACWPWTGSIVRSRWPVGHHYGVVMINGRRQPARRIAYRLQTGVELGPGEKIGCTCHDTLCCNGAHLYHADAKTISGKCRQSRGTEKQNAKLSGVLVRLARAKVRAGAWSYREAARRLGVDFRTVRCAVLGLTWRHVS